MKTPLVAPAVALLGVVVQAACSDSSPSQTQGKPSGAERTWSDPNWNNLPARAQVRLRQMGFYRGPIHGQLDAATHAALTRYQTERKLKVTGQLDPWTMRALRL